MMKSIFLFSSLLFCFGLQLNSQDLQADLLKTQLFFLNEKSYAVDTEVWQKESAKAPVTLVNRTVIKKSDTKFRYEMGDAVSIIYPNQFLIIDEISKEMIYQQVNMPKPDIMAQLEKMNQQIKSVEYLGIDNGEKIYRIELSSIHFDQAEIRFAAETEILKNVKYNYRDPLEDEPVYMEQRFRLLSKIPGDTDFDMEAYISASAEGITANKKYSDYTIVY